MAEKRLFVIALDHMDPTIDSFAAKAQIQADTAFSGWWNHLPGIFPAVSECDGHTITDLIRSVTGEQRLLVIEANPAESAGWLPGQRWDWIGRRPPASAAQASPASIKQTA